MSRTFFIKDNVCTPYKLILNKTSQYLTANGWRSVTEDSRADVCIIGACGAFHSLEEEALGFLASARKNRQAFVVAFGCLVRISPERIASLSPDRVIPSPEWERLEELVEKPKVRLASIPEANEFRLAEEYRLYDPGKKFVLIQTGCSADCPYCPHKLGIGELKSRPVKEILDQVRVLTEKGAHTIILHGNDTGSYGTDTGEATYPELLEKVLEVSPDIHVTQFSADWAWKYRESLFPLLLNPKVKDFQVLIQSASNRVLALMERGQVVKSLRKDLAALRRQRPDLLLRTDVIIGYPTATEEEEKETLEYVSDIFDEVAVHAFERFPRTRIEKMGLPFYSESRIKKRTAKAVDYLKNIPGILVHHGGQQYETLCDIEGPKERLRHAKTESDSSKQRWLKEEQEALVEVG